VSIYRPFLGSVGDSKEKSKDHGEERFDSLKRREGHRGQDRTKQKGIGAENEDQKGTKTEEWTGWGGIKVLEMRKQTYKGKEIQTVGGRSLALALERHTGVGKGTDNGRQHFQPRE